MDTILVSIIIPFYNVPRHYFKKCLSSLFEQSYSNIEILVVDDGSTKEYSDFLDEICSTDSRVKLFHKENGGVSSARNLALSYARGEYICFVDSDDWVDKDFIKQLVNAIQKNVAEIAVCNWMPDYEHVDEENVFSRNEVCIEVTYTQCEAYSKILHSKEIQGFLCNKIFCKNLITKTLNESYHYCEDLVFVAHYLNNVRKMVYCNQCLYHYRQSGVNATSNFSYNPKILSLLSAYKEVETIYIERNLHDSISVEKNLLKIALNIRARFLINKIKNSNGINSCNQVIKNKIKRIISSHDVDLSEKVNIILTWLMPVFMFRIKCLILHRQINEN